MQHIESSTKIYWTSEYGRFKFLKGNRDLNSAKVEKIKKAIQNGVNILKYAPIIVNDNMEIIDGQHRFAVSRELKENVYYVIQSAADLSVVPAINSNSSNWKTSDYLNSYIDLKKEHYLKLQEFMLEWVHINLATAINVCTKSDNKIAKELFRDGEYKCDNLEEAHELSKFLFDFVPFTDNPFSSRFYEVARQMRKSEAYVHDLMIAKLKESGRRIAQVHSVKSIIEEMESIINHRLKNRIYIV